MSELRARSKLAEYLDQFPGFTPSTTGADIRLLKRLFTEEEAKLALHLTLDQEETHVIAARANLSLEKTEKLLDGMEKKGLLFSVNREDGTTVYQAVPFVLGIYEFQVDRMDEGFINDLEEFWSTSVSRDRPETISQMRVIPVGKSIDASELALPYEKVEELVDQQDRFAVANCICRQKEKQLGRGCNAPEESCLIFGDYADYYVRNGLARHIDKNEAKDLLIKADEANLVLRPTNSKFISAICCCCGCCCGGLVSLNMLSRPAEVVTSAYITEFEPENCINCGVCIDRCQMHAFSKGDSYVTFNVDRCIGCGLCVSSCPSQALKLKLKPGADDREIPDTLFDAWHTITKQLANK
jgi:NAD-dependent dihydropyrimidine dehydrogenase PreA subunit